MQHKNECVALQSVDFESADLSNAIIVEAEVRSKTLTDHTQSLMMERICFLIDAVLASCRRLQRSSGG